MRLRSALRGGPVKSVLVTGGAGFIGSNLAARLIRAGKQVTVFDNMSRSHSGQNIDWLRHEFGDESFSVHVADLSDFDAVERAVDGAEQIFHLGGQVAVTDSIVDPMLDFHSNVTATFNILEAARASQHDPVVLYASTNKVYGEISSQPVAESSRYLLPDLPSGVSETQPLDFQTPYGCSSGSADQYVLDYHRTYGVRSVVFRQSCIYGPRQFGGEDQGWVAWLMLAAMRGHPITIYGDGLQVRDVLFIDDLLDAYSMAAASIDRCGGHVFNIGGGPDNTISIWAEFGPMIERLLGHQVDVSYGDWRLGDQRVYVSDITKATSMLGWKPATSVDAGIRQLADWLRNESGLLAGISG